MQRDGERVGDGMIDGEEFEFVVAFADRVAFLDVAEFEVADAVFTELRGDERQRELRAVDRDVAALLQQVRDGTDVVLMAVREDERDDVVEAIVQVVQRWEDEIDSRM